MAQDCASSVQVCAMRVAALGADGVPAPGAKNLYVTNALILLTHTPVYKEGTVKEQENGCGDLCIYQKDCDRLERVDLEMQLCSPDPQLHQMLIGGTLIAAGSDDIGLALPAVGAAGCPNGVSIEAWSKAWIQDSQAVDRPWIRWVFPRTYWKLGPKSLHNDIMQNPLSGYGSENDNFFNGPGNDYPSSALAVSHRCMSWFRDSAIPATSCGARTLTGS